MNKYLDCVISEIEPFHDLDRHMEIKCNGSLGSYLRDIGEYYVNMLKHTLRGGAVGSLGGGMFGAVGTALSGSSPLEGFIEGAKLGAVYGAFIDNFQYVSRFIFYRAIDRDLLPGGNVPSIFSE